MPEISEKTSGDIAAFLFVQKQISFFARLVEMRFAVQHAYDFGMGTVKEFRECVLHERDRLEASFEVASDSEIEFCVRDAENDNQEWESVSWADIFDLSSYKAGTASLHAKYLAEIAVEEAKDNASYDVLEAEMAAAKYKQVQALLAQVSAGALTAEDLATRLVG
jgi:hypothetical protein